MIVEIEGTATIKGNITYTNEILNSIYDIPQVIIFADNIDIAPSVTQIDAWLMVGLNNATSQTKLEYTTTGEINNCANGITEDTLIAANGPYGNQGDNFMPGTENDGNLSKACNSRLKINGPVQARKLRLLRSYGAGMGLQCEYSYQHEQDYTSGAWQAQWPNAGKIANCGGAGIGTGPFPYDSATPAEVFNLRADTYLWAFRQVENYSQAFVTFSREVAPRW